MAPSWEDIKALIAGLGDLTKAISGATLQEKAAVYHALGIQGTYHRRNDACGSRRTSTRTLLAPHLLVGKWLVSGGRHEPIPNTRSRWSATLTSIRPPCRSKARHVDELREQMTTELTLLNDRMPRLSWLDIAERKSGAIRLTPAEAQP